MIIGFDGKRAVKNYTGLGNYSRLVIESTARLMPDTKMLVYTPELKENPRLNIINQLDNVEFRTPPPQGFHGSLWRTYGVTNNLDADHVDIYHGLSNELPLNIRSSKAKSIVTIHDLIFLTLPDCYKFIDRKLYNFKYKRSCLNADHIVTISECTKRDVMKYYNIPEEKISVIYQGCDDIFRQHIPAEKRAEFRETYNIKGRFAVQVGTIEKRKNLELSVRALPYFPKDMSLVVVGRNRLSYKDYIEKIAKDNGTLDRIIFLDKLPFTELPKLYAEATVALNPSRYEGFGIPILEALETSTPVIAAKGSCLEETGGPGSIYISPDDTKGMAEAVNAIADGTIDLNRMKALGKRHATNFSTVRMVSSLSDLYRTLLNTERKV